MTVYTYDNKRLELAELPIASGGEGAVYEIIGYPTKLAKIYHDCSEAKKRADKINAMVDIYWLPEFQNAGLDKDIAWPRAALYSDSKDFIGFGMNRIDSENELDDLYAYPAIKEIGATTINKIDCLISLCSIIEKLHSLGQVFGDFNPNNIKIRKDWTVCFMDADSYSVRTDDNEYDCIVCAPGYVAPELIKKCKGITYEDYEGETFNNETDRYALAIHIFRMLMNGCHPFSCVKQINNYGSVAAPPIDDRVEKGETPFFTKVQGYTIPHYAPDINSFSPYIYSLFVRAFVEGYTDATKRPNETEWKSALLKYKKELKKCKRNEAHYYWIKTKYCPYCEADNRNSANMARIFSVPVDPSSISPSVAGTTDLPISEKEEGQRKWFWTITVAVAALIQIALFLFFYPDFYTLSEGNEDAKYVLGILNVIAGVSGSIVYNIKRKSRDYSVKQYLFSLGASFVFTIGFVVALIALEVFIYMIGQLAIAIIGIGIVLGLVKGAG